MGLACNDEKCVATVPCDQMKGKVPDLKLSLSNRMTIEIKGDDLLSPLETHIRKGEEVVTNEICKLLMFNSHDQYIAGSIVLKDYYSVYDVENRRIGLGPIFDFEADIEKPVIPDVPAVPDVPTDNATDIPAIINEPDAH